jgi:hypothetical protein
MFRRLLALSPEDVLPTIYLCTNRIAPDYENVGSEEAAKKSIYNVSCERYFGFGCQIDRKPPINSWGFLEWSLFCQIRMWMQNIRIMEGNY